MLPLRLSPSNTRWVTRPLWQEMPSQEPEQGPVAGLHEERRPAGSEEDLKD